MIRLYPVIFIKTKKEVLVEVPDFDVRDYLRTIQETKKQPIDTGL